MIRTSQDLLQEHKLETRIQHLKEALQLDPKNDDLLDELTTLSRQLDYTPTDFWDKHSAFQTHNRRVAGY